MLAGKSYFYSSFSQISTKPPLGCWIITCGAPKVAIVTAIEAKVVFTWNGSDIRLETTACGLAVDMQNVGVQHLPVLTVLLYHFQLHAHGYLHIPQVDIFHLQGMSWCRSRWTFPSCNLCNQWLACCWSCRLHASERSGYECFSFVPVFGGRSTSLGCYGWWGRRLKMTSFETGANPSVPGHD